MVKNEHYDAFFPTLSTKKRLRYDNPSGISLPPVDTNVKRIMRYTALPIIQKFGRLPPSTLCMRVRYIVSFQSFIVLGTQNDAILKNSLKKVESFPLEKATYACLLVNILYSFMVCFTLSSQL